MAEVRVQRRLAAILAADVVGYSRLMGENEAGTLASLKELQAKIIDPAISEHQGRIVKLMGDGVLVEFASVVDAVECAVAIQNAIGTGKSEIDGDEQLVVRIGINVGDVIIDGDDIYGDGVNIAARLEGLADPGGICVSEKVYAEVHNKLGASFEDLGPKQVKNIATPVRAYRVSLGRAPQPASLNPLVLPNKPSIAVLPFDNMSGDPEQEYFADGIVEDLTTDLSKISGLFVVARNSAATFKGRPVNIRSAAAELGVRYVLEGSVRKSGTRVRINAQLIEADAGGHLWAERYDGTVDDVFELQDEVCAKVVAALSVQLTTKESNSLKAVHATNLEAYELFVRGRATPFPPVPQRIESARQIFQQVIELDPDFAGGYAGVSAMMSIGAIFTNADTRQIIQQAELMARKALSVDPTFGWSYTALGMALFQRDQYAEAIEATNEAITRQPSDADAHAYQGMILGFDGQLAAASDSVNRAIRLNPVFFNGPYLNLRCLIELLAEQYDTAIATFQENSARNGPVGPPALSWLAAAYAGKGLLDEAHQLSTQMKEKFPGFTMTNLKSNSLIRDKNMRERVIGLMRKAGVPEN